MWFLLTIISAEQCIVPKKCIQKVSKQIVHKKCSQKVSTIIPYKKYPNEVYNENEMNNPKKVITFPLGVKKKIQICIELIMPPAGLPNKGLRKKLYLK